MQAGVEAESETDLVMQIKDIARKGDAVWPSHPTFGHSK